MAAAVCGVSRAADGAVVAETMAEGERFRFMEALSQVSQSHTIEEQLRLTNQTFSQREAQFLEQETALLELENVQALLVENEDEEDALLHTREALRVEEEALAAVKGELNRVRNNIAQVKSEEAAIISELAELYEELEAERKDTQEEETLQNYQTMLTWYEEVAATITTLSGVTLESFDGQTMHLLLTPLLAASSSSSSATTSPHSINLKSILQGITSSSTSSSSSATFQLVVKLKEETTHVESISLFPPLINISDIISSVRLIEDLRAVLPELKGRLNNALKRKNEIETLMAAATKKRNASTAFLWSEEESLLTVTFKNGSGCELLLDGDYPRPYSRVRCRKLISASSSAFMDEEKRRRREEEVEELRRRVNEAEEAMSVTEVVEVVEQGLAALLRSA
ncbi:hypothetical protein QOT17_008374 [Balamuthia mandrillaris]